MSDRVSAFAPASIGNVAVGFDVLGLALEGVGDRVTATRTDGDSVLVTAVFAPDGSVHPELSAEPTENTASIAAQALWNDHGSGGVSLELAKGVPLQSGMGSSAASAVAAVVAANALLDDPLPKKDLLPYALEGEKFASKGLHADNVAPSLLGGLVLCPTALLPDVVELASPTGISAVLVHPELRVDTAAARQGLDLDVPMSKWIEQQGLLAGFIAGCVNNDADLISRSLKDVIIEPQRSANVSCFDAVMEGAKGAGALGGSLSGSGPSMFALAKDADAQNVANAMADACKSADIECQTWISPMNAQGAYVEA